MVDDPSDRFAEILDCGCEWHAGTVFYCEEHLPRAPAAPVPDSLESLRTEWAKRMTFLTADTPVQDAEAIQDFVERLFVAWERDRGG